MYVYIYIYGIYIYVGARPGLQEAAVNDIYTYMYVCMYVCMC